MSKWEQVPLADLCTFQRGLTYSKSDEVQYSANGVLRANNIDFSTNQLNLSDIRYISDAVEVPFSKKVRPGTLLICTASGSRAHLGKVALVEGDHDLAFGGFMGLIDPSNLIGSRYLYYALTGGQFKAKLGSLAVGTNINNLKFKDISDFPVPLPPLEEQRRIVAVLDKAFGAIATATANAEKNLLNARELFAVHRERVLRQSSDEWGERPLSDLCTIKHGFAFKSEYFEESGSHVLLTPGNFFESGGYRDRGPKQKYYDGPMPRGFVLQGGDLLVAMTEQATGLLGSPILVPTEGIYLHNQRLGLVEPKSGVEWANQYFFHIFNSKQLRDQIHRTGTGQKVRHTSPAKIGDVSVRFPNSRREQLAVAAFLDELWVECDRLYDVGIKQVAKLEELKQSLLLSAFSGELIATEPEKIAA